MGRVVVFGSLNADTVLEVESFPAPGETIRALASHTGPGGKGLNQAVAAARMGGAAVMVGAVGTDPAAESLRRALAAEPGLDSSHVRTHPGATGQAFVTVEAGGENNIVIVPGANASHTPETARAQLGFLRPADVLVCQLEVPSGAVAAGLEFASSRGVYTILNAAPAADVRHMLGGVDLLVVNETEAAAIASGYPAAPGRTPLEVARNLRESTQTDVVLTLGSSGLVYATEHTAAELSAYEISPVDTTGAGDAFVGGLATMIAEKRGLVPALEFASALGALACKGAGAQGYTATREEVHALTRRR